MSLIGRRSRNEAQTDRFGLSREGDSPLPNSASWSSRPRDTHAEIF
jgi:hypothetical protein